MKGPRFAILIAVLASTALIAVPSAGAKGTAFTLSFDTVYKAGKPAAVKNFVYSNLLLTCTEGSTTYSPPKQFPKMRLNDELEFKGTLVIRGVRSKVVGKYRKDLSKVTGKLKASGDTKRFTNCRSGWAPWKAS
jgi:hypothetical protein